MFGCSAVFAFLAQDALSPGSAGAASEVVREGGGLSGLRRGWVWGGGVQGCGPVEVQGCRAKGLGNSRALLMIKAPILLNPIIDPFKGTLFKGTIKAPILHESP